MLNVALKVSSQPKNTKNIYMLVNQDKDIVRRKCKDDPSGRGARKFKPMLRKLLE